MKAKRNGKVSLRIVITAICMMVLGAFSDAYAQHRHLDHDLYHASYQSWKNRDNNGCCNDKDCKPLLDIFEREVSGGDVEVFVIGVGVAEGKSSWCKVQSFHYLSVGNAPNWSVSHICVSDHYGGTTPCQQFICYQPRARF